CSCGSTPSPSASRADRSVRRTPLTCRCSRISRSCSAPASICRRLWSPGSRTWRDSWDSAMPSLAEIIQGSRTESHRPWPRIVVTADAWRHVASELAAGRATLLGLWGDADPAPLVHMALSDAAAGEILVASLACPDRKFPSIGALHPPAIRLERAIQSLYGYEPTGAPDRRAWLDLGFWGV